MSPDIITDTAVWVAEHLPHIIAAWFFAFSGYQAAAHGRELRAAYERGRKDERAAVVAWLLRRQDAAIRRRQMMLTPRLESVTTGQILEAGDAATEIRDGHHQTTTSEDDQ